jgi:hypothetical protein
VTPFLLILALLLGLAPGMIAHGKGRNFFAWWIYGVVLGPIALIHAMLLNGTKRPQFAVGPRRPRTRWDSPWPLLLWAGCSFAIAILAIAAYRVVVPADGGKPGDGREVSISADRTPATTPSAEPKSVARPTTPEESNAILTKPALPNPTVRVTIRQDEPVRDETASTPRAPAAPTERAERKDRTEPPPAAPDIPAAKRPLERTKADPVEPPPEPKSAPVEDVRTARAMPAPPPESDRPVKSADERPAPKAQKRTEERESSDPKVPADVTAIGETVRVVQVALAERGYEPGPANGRAGRQTQLAIRKFQLDRGLEPTGTIDYAVLEQLNIVGPRVHAFQPPPGALPGR